MGGQMLPPFGWQQVLGRWDFGPVVTVLAAAAALAYLEGALRLARRDPARRWPWWRAGMFLGGLAVIALATESGIGAYSDVLFWDHMIQHLMLIMIAPAMLVLGQPLRLLTEASGEPLRGWAGRALRSRVVTWLTCPVVGVAAYTATIIGTHLTGFMNVIMTSQAAADGEHVLYLVAGYLFFLPVIGREPIRWRLTYPVRLLLLFLTMPVDTFTGLVLNYSSTPMAGMSPRPAWAPSPVSDLHAGGAVMWVGGDALMFAFMMVVFLAWSREGLGFAEGHGWLEAARRASFAGLTGSAGSTVPAAAGPAAPGSAAPGPAGPAAPARPADEAPANDEGTIDDDEHLAAYNAFLARISAHPRRDGDARG